MRRLRASHSYGLVLALTLAAFVFCLVAPSASWAGSVLVLLQSVALVCALWTSGVASVASRWSVMLLGVSVASAVVNLVVSGADTDAATGVLSGLLTAAVAVIVALGVVDQGTVNLQSVRGAIAIYVLIGLMFVFFYGVVAALGSGPFFAQGTDGTRALRTYFSFVTLTTTGYGDYTASGTAGHTLAVFEALFGQLYLVTVVALLVARLGKRNDEAPPLIPPG